ncbi:DNA-binding protein [Sphingomonas crocodyli]|uniref:DNA-binding protein n=2 Tax=Sphingomonas crocodyli TaxID=1979270 RepID=A0A437MBQ1_9SPHN|nr:DNA-binding protein [Sphingomonas crocodyli]
MPDAPARQLPALEKDNEAFWTGGANGALMICRCAACDLYIHPPLPQCPQCAGAVAPQAVSGRARVASYTINVQPWLPGMKVPFLFAAVELEEQKELYVMTNIVGCPVDQVTIGMPVSVVFEQHDDVWLPMFQPTEAPHAG